MTTVDAPILRQPAQPDTRPAVDPEAYALETALRGLIQLGAATSHRDRQHAVGASEIGHPCERRLAYRLSGARPVNVTDPTRALVGTGWHTAMAELFTRLDGGSGRFIVETPVRYRGIPGHVDLYDRLTGTVVDWKTTLRGKLSRVRIDGPAAQYVTQLHVYGAALTAAGETVRYVALAYTGVDSTLDDMYVWRAPYDARIADATVDRLNRLSRAELETKAGMLDPTTVEATPTALCRWCPWWRDGPLTVASCPGKER